MKNLLKEEKNKDILKIALVILFNMILFSVLRAGFDYQKMIPTRAYEKPVSLKQYKYEIISNGVSKNESFNERKNLIQILDAFYEKNIEIRIIRDGYKIESIYNNQNFKIYVNNQEINKNQVPETEIAENTKITINY